ncbi:MAG: hypothetical protein A2234_11260 [Elusimicrobia bacterium RIFOXYA2_FULL_58_8]|nr:MAG: hypothetical protein A2285_08540 [Elusimicrobia bacterium RIFOXYA12_FULL_57_11]OGS14518.1 MAG: hypothetical protein A2234_11260 [Elusimicrobia bacterium RIFOXYA2_FULL_58_8]
MVKQERAVRVEVDTAVYPAEAVYAAANTFAGKAFVRLGIKRKGIFVVELGVKPGVGAAGLEGEFYNELLHHALRLKVSARHHALRERIVAQALVSAQLPQGVKPAAGKQEAVDAGLEKEIEKLLKEAESGSYKTDPMGIAVPWEKKHARKPVK